MPTLSVWNKGQWAPGPQTHGRGRPHEIADIHFDSETGCDSTVSCVCGWTSSGPTPEHIERAYAEHRRSLGLQGTVLSLGLSNYR
jgi:hypothetical protein